VIKNHEKSPNKHWGFFDRSAELEILNLALEHGRKGKLKVVFVSGEPGIGKTRLAEEFTRFAQSSGAVVAWGKWRDGEPLPEFGVWKRILRNILKSYELVRPGIGLDSSLVELSSLLPEIRDMIPGLETPIANKNEHSRLRLFDAVNRTLQYAAKIKPLVLIFDNIHLAVEASLTLLEGLFDELADSPILVIATYRDLPAYRTNPFLSFLSDVKLDMDVSECKLGNLEEGDVIALLNDALERPAPPPLVHKILRLTKGNPLFVKEIAKLMRSHPENPPGGDQWELEFPDDMNVIIARRFKQLSTLCTYTLQQAAVIGETCSLEELSMLFPKSADATLGEVIAEAVGYGFLQRGEKHGEYHFSHAVIHQAILSQLPPSEHNFLCRQLAALVENAHSQNLKPWTRKLAHWYSYVSNDEGQSRYRTYVRLAAETAIEECAWEEALSLYQKIINPSLTARDDQEAEVLYGMGKVYSLSGDRFAGAQFLRKAFEYYKSHGCLERMIEIATQTGYPKTGEPGFHDYFEDILPLLPKGSVTEGMVLYFYGIAQIRSLEDYSRATETLLRSCELGLQNGDSRLIMRALCALAYIDNRFHRFEQALRRADEVAQHLDSVDDPFAACHISLVMCEAYTALGNHEFARFWEEKGLESAKRTRDGGFIAVARYLLARSFMAHGDWEGALHEIEEGLYMNRKYIILLAARCFMEYTIGEFDSGDRTRAQILSLHQSTPPGPYHVHIHAASSEVVRARNSGDIRGLKEHIPMLKSIAEHQQAIPFIRLRAHLLLAFIAFLTSDPKLAGDQYRDIAESENIYIIRPYYKERILGLAAQCFGDFEKALRHLHKALKEADKYRDKPLQAWILCELGEVLVARKKDHGDLTEGRERYLDAQTRAKTLRMLPLQQRVQNNLTVFKHIAQSGKIGSFILTGREREILRLLAHGFSNASIAGRLNISRYTVINHVRNILDKTASSNRTEAVAVAQKVGLL
jgi:DNA-binding CsgD family transcriptional regulator